MKFQNIQIETKRPELYSKGNAQMWTDDYISDHLLAVHLNNEVDLASRNGSTIDSTVEWILKVADGKKLNILDLGCGPGLYAEKLARMGHNVTGVDFSERSINYAKKSAAENQLDLRYLNENYLNLSLASNQFDLVIMVFTDFGVLQPSEREILLHNIKKVLKPEGTFIFDVLSDIGLEEKISPFEWECSEEGFWKNRPYLRLSNSFLYEKQKVILYQHCLISEDEQNDVYRFWTHFFSNYDLEKILQKNGFHGVGFFNDILPATGIWDGQNVTFAIAKLMD